MGHYTELVLKCQIKKDIPYNVKGVLNHLFNGIGNIKDLGFDLPEHAFFRCQRWDHIGSTYSAYHVPFALSRYDNDYLFSRSDFKNYDHEIEKFLDWLTPYIDLDNCEYGEDNCIGWVWDEDNFLPIMITLKITQKDCIK